MWRNKYLLTQMLIRIYNVITMKASIITIGNSRGIRIPKVLPEESGIEEEVEIKASRGILRIIPVKRRSRRANETALLSEEILRRDWDRPEEDEAWAGL